MKRIFLGGVLAASVGVLAGCEEISPTSTDDGLLPVSPQTVEIRLPFETFGRDLQVVGGFGRPSEMGTAVVARGLGGSLESRALVRFGAYPGVASVPDGGTTRADSALTFIGGRVIARFDTLSVPEGETVELSVSALEAPWHPGTASWQLAVDSIGETLPWPEPGAGPARHLTSLIWSREEGDSAVFAVDSLAVAAWGDTTNAARGLRMDVETEGKRLLLRSAVLRLDVRPSVNPDTVIELSVAAPASTFVYDPFPEPVEGEIRVGGVPAWRTVLRVELPPELDGIPDLCARLTCPFLLTPEAVNYAALVLESRQTVEGFRPADTLTIDVRPVLSPDRLPKSPLGSPVSGVFGQFIPPSYFDTQPGSRVTLPVTGWFQDLVRGSTAAGGEVSSTLAILSAFEPLSLGFGTFAGAGVAGAPFLRLIVTVGPGVTLP